MCVLSEFVQEIYKHLTGKYPHHNANIIRIHTRKLEQLGDLSFPKNLTNWQCLLNDTKLEPGQCIFNYLSSENTLIEKSFQWSISIAKIVHNGRNVALHVDRQNVFQSTIKNVLHLKSKYGSHSIKLHKRIIMMPKDITNHFSKINLSELKLNILEKTIMTLLQFTENFNAFTKQGASDSKGDFVHIKFSLTSTKNDLTNKTLLCGAVLNESGSKDFTTTAEELLRRRTMDMRLMAEHKYGLRVTSNTGWRDFFKKLGEAAIILHMLENKPQNTTTVLLNVAESVQNKGAPFILYNCARLNTLLKEFDKKVASNVYPPLPPLEKVTFALLSEPEEWELLFVYILQFPSIIRDSIKDIENGRVNPHYLISYLHRLASTFSVYYRRIRILKEPREHLIPVLHERIYLLKALEQVIHNSLYVLNIEPVKQM